MSEAVDTVDTEQESGVTQAEATAPGGVAEGAEGSEEEEAAEELGTDETVLVREGDVAGDYLERLLDVLDYDGDIDLDVDNDRAVVSIDGGSDLDNLVGSHGSVLEALQELTRLAVQQETGTRSRLMLDISGWRAGRREELAELGRSTAESVRDKGESARLRPMSPFERKIVHDAVAAVEGVYSESEGENPKRRVVVHPEQ